MENASKALIMAGAILIAIMLISIGLVIINSTKGVVDQGTQAAKIIEMQTFNSKFIAYEGEKKGSEVKQLINLVRASNIEDSEHQIVVFMYNGNISSNIVDTKTYSVSLNYYSLDYLNSMYRHFKNSGQGFYVLIDPEITDNEEEGYINCVNITLK